MLNGLTGPSTAASLLRESLDASASRVRAVAHRVANAGTEGFAASLAQAQGAADPADPATVAAVDLEAEMVGLADEQLRFEAASRLLQKVYAQIRSSVRER